jgi:hypothetical protein
MENIPNDHRIYQMVKDIPNCIMYTDQMAIKIYQHLLMHDITKFTQIGIFGLKIYIIWQTWIRPPQTEDVCMSNTPPGQKQDFLEYDIVRQN